MDLSEKNTLAAYIIYRKICILAENSTLAENTLIHYFLQQQSTLEHLQLFLIINLLIHMDWNIPKNFST
jgi:hypothetical protein